MTCKDCMHIDVCEIADNKEYLNEDCKKADCPKFKNKADYVEVVRCDKCVYYDPLYGNGKIGICTHLQSKRNLKHDEDYCSLGFKTKE